MDNVGNSAFVRSYSPIPLQLLYNVNTPLSQHHSSTTYQHISQNTVLSFADVDFLSTYYVSDTALNAGLLSIMRNRPDVATMNFKVHPRAFSHLQGGRSKHRWTFDTILL